jgi:RND family efflux transporter MFP subunit
MSTRHFVFIAYACALAFAAGSAFAGQILPLTAAQKTRLGIVVAEALAPADAPALAFQARVVLPASSVRVVAAAGAALVTQLHVQAGDPVRRGAPLVTLSMPGLAEAKNGHTQARLRAELADANAARDRKLFDEGLIAEARLRATETEAQSARAALAAAQAALASLGQGAVSGSTITLLAPIAGVVTESMAHPGLRVDAGTALMTLADVSKLALEIPLSPEQAKAVALGQRVRVRDSEADGRVVALLPQVDAAQSVLARASLADPHKRLRPGQWVRVELVGPRAGAGRIVPASALVWKANAPYVFVETARGFAPTPVTLIRQNTSQAEVSGVPAGAHVAVKGVAALKAQWLGE